MIDEEVVQTQDPVLELPPDIEPLPDPEPVAPPVEVVPVDEFFDRLAEMLTEEDSAPEESEEVIELPAEDPEDVIAVIDDLPDLPAADPTVGLVEQVVRHLLDMIVDLGKIEEHTSTIQEVVDHPALTTSFADYTVTEALLLLLLLSAFISACARMLRGGFSWLRS